MPISGGFWDGEMEICFNRSATYGAWGWAHACWNDLIAVHRCEECTRRVLFETMLPATAIVAGDGAYQRQRGQYKWGGPAFSSACQCF